MHKKHLFKALGIASTALLASRLAVSQQISSEAQPPVAPLTPVPQASPTPTFLPPLMMSKTGEVYRPQQTFGTADLGAYRYRFVMREVPSPYPEPKEDLFWHPRLVIFEVDRQKLPNALLAVPTSPASPASQKVSPQVVWRSYTSYNTGSFVYPHYDGDIAASPDGSLVVMISNRSDFNPGIFFLRVQPKTPVLPPQPVFTAGGDLMLAQGKPVTNIRYSPFTFAPWTYNPSDRVKRYALEKVTLNSLLVRVEPYTEDPARFRYDFKTKKWSEVVPTKAELAAQKKAEERRAWMDEYRDRREIFGLTKERATAAVRARSGIKDWEPLKEAWDTPDLKSKRYWLTPTPAPTPTSTPAPASAAPVPAAPVPPAP